MFGLMSRAQILALTGAMIAGDAERALRELNDLAKSGKDLTRLVSELLSHFRNLLIYQVSKGDLSLLEVSEDEAATLKQRAAEIPTDALTRIMEVLSDCESNLRDAVSKKIMIEVALFRAIEARNAVPIDAVLKKLGELRAGGSSGGSAPTAPRPVAATATAKPATPAPAPAKALSEMAASALKEVPASAPAPAPVAAPAPAPVAAPAHAPKPAAAAVAESFTGDLELLWAQVLDGVGHASPFTRSHLTEAFPVSFEKGVLSIGFDPEFKGQIGLVDNSRNRTVLQTKLAELGHREAQVKFVVQEAPAGRKPVVLETAPPPDAVPGETPAAKPAAKEKLAPISFDDFKNDPLIKQALELFKGQIVDVRV
jgi:DNA polymerase-3 subunit gamma/tau